MVLKPSLPKVLLVLLPALLYACATPPQRPGRPPPPAPAAEAVETTYREAVKQGIVDALNRDDRVFLMGEDVGRYGGCYAVSKGLLDQYGPQRVRDTPLSESGFTGAGIGAAAAGMRGSV